MTLQYVENNIIRTKELEKINVFYGLNGTGKTDFMNFLSDGLQGKGDFLIDGLEVDKTLFNVTLLNDDFKYSDFLKFKKRGKIFKDYESAILENLKDSIDRYLEQVNKEIQSNIHNDFFDKLNNSIILNKVNLEVGFDKFSSIYDDIFSLTFSSPLSSSSLFEIALKYMVLYKDDSRHNIFLIDDFDKNFDVQRTEDFIDFMAEQDNCVFLLTTSQTKSVARMQEISAKIYLDYNKYINIRSCLQYAFIRDNFLEEDEKDFDEYYSNNIQLVDSNDVEVVFNTIKPLLPHIVNNVLLENSYEYKIKYANSFSEILLAISSTKNPITPTSSPYP